MAANNSKKLEVAVSVENQTALPAEQEPKAPPATKDYLVREGHAIFVSDHAGGSLKIRGGEVVSLSSVEAKLFNHLGALFPMIEDDD